MENTESTNRVRFREKFRIGAIKKPRNERWHCLFQTRWDEFSMYVFSQSWCVIPVVSRQRPTVIPPLAVTRNTKPTLFVEPSVFALGSGPRRRNAQVCGNKPLYNRFMTVHYNCRQNNDSSNWFSGTGAWKNSRLDKLLAESYKIFDLSGQESPIYRERAKMGGSTRSAWT